MYLLLFLNQALHKPNCFLEDHVNRWIILTLNKKPLNSPWTEIVPALPHCGCSCCFIHISFYSELVERVLLVGLFQWATWPQCHTKNSLWDHRLALGQAAKRDERRIATLRVYIACTHQTPQGKKWRKKSM